MIWDRLKPEEMEEHIKANTFRLAFVGMSNGGKSYRSKVLQNDCGFFWYEVDAHIQGVLDLKNMEDISEWLGFPTTTTHKERSKMYLEAEEKCTKLSNLDTDGKNLVFDTTGSVIYLSNDTKDWLHKKCLIVHIDVGEDSIPEMSERYFKEPKPVIWGDSFNQVDGEGDLEAMKRCYPNLLKNRLKMYRELSHLSIPVAEFYDKDGVKTLKTIKSHL